MRKFIVIFIILFLTQLLFAQYKSPTEYHTQSIYDLVNEKEENINIGFWALIIAKEFDSSIYVKKYLNKLDEMAEEIKRMIAGRERDMDKFLATKMFLYEAGEWNDYKPFSYDLEDPLGEILEHQLLSNYIDSRKGNCVSMPTLFLTLMERVDPSIPFSGVKAPLHLFCRLRDRQTGDVWNVETTNGGNPARNQWYIDQMNISQTAIESGLFLKDLSKKEFIANLLSPLIAKERRKGKFEKSMKFAELVLRIMPNSDLGLVSKGALISEIGYKKFQNGELSEEEYLKEEEKSYEYIDKAKSLGWNPRTKEDKDKYLEEVKLELNKNKK